MNSRGAYGSQHQSKRKRTYGFSLLELLLVVGLVAILAGAAAPFYSRFVRRNNHEVTTDEVLGALRKAQSNSMHGKNNTEWGVCLSGSTLRMYAGSCASPTIAEEYQVPGSTSIVGLTDTTFTNLRGEPSGTLSITISSVINTTTVTLNAAGGIEIN